jgi:hypothetical protein
MPMRDHGTDIHNKTVTNRCAKNRLAATGCRRRLSSDEPLHENVDVSAR